MPDKYSSLASGLQGGFGMAMQANQVKQSRRQQEWQNDFTAMSTLLQTANMKGLSDTSRIDLTKKAGDIWNKYYPDTKFPDLTPETMPDFMPVIKNLNDLGQQASERKLPWETAFMEGNKQIAEFNAKNSKNAETLEKSKQILGQALAPLEQGYKQEQSLELFKGKEKVKGTADSPAKIRAGIMRKYLENPNSLNDQEKTIIGRDLQDPYMNAAIKAYGQNMGNLGKTPEQQMEALDHIANTLRGKSTGAAGIREVPQFASEQEAKQAAADGKIKAGDRIKIGDGDSEYTYQP